jgi:hypothetical protein
MKICVGQTMWEGALSAHTTLPETSTCSIVWKFFLFFWQFWGLNLGLAFARQVLYHLSHAPTLFALAIYSGKVLHFLPWSISACSPLPTPPE